MLYLMERNFIYKVSEYGHRYLNKLVALSSLEMRNTNERKIVFANPN